MGLKKLIPLWGKLPVAVLLAEAGKWPASVVLAHMRRAFAENGGCGEEGKFRVRQAAHKQTYRYLEKRYGHLVDPNAGYLGSLTENTPVWVFWWQGEENAPLLVQRCIQSLRQHAGSHPIRVVHQDNYRTFVSIPAHIEEKRERGIISLTHFSDILRMALLAEHGGLWLDATIYATGSLEEAFAGDLFTVRNPGQEKENVSRWEWSGYAIGGGEGSDLFRLASDIFSAYWLDHNSMIDYFLIDYTLRLIVDTCPKIRSALESVAPNNRGIYHYQKHFNDPADMLPPENTWLYKLSWKGSYSPVTETGEESLYGRWLRETEEMK